jgi:hypothetical protein
MQSEVKEQELPSKTGQARPGRHFAAAMAVRQEKVVKGSHWKGRKENAHRQRDPIEG